MFDLKYIILLIISTNVYGGELERVGFRAESYYTKYDPFIPEYTTVKRPQLPYQNSGRSEQWSLGLTLFLDMSAEDTYWKNNIRGMTTTDQFRYVAWEFEIGQRLGDHVSIFYYHHSEHGMDILKEGYPLQDSFGISLCFFGTKCNN